MYDAYLNVLYSPTILVRRGCDKCALAMHALPNSNYYRSSIDVMMSNQAYDLRTSNCRPQQREPVDVTTSVGHVTGKCTVPCKAYKFITQT
jgi:hypothetical protein